MSATSGTGGTPSNLWRVLGMLAVSAAAVQALRGRPAPDGSTYAPEGAGPVRRGGKRRPVARPSDRDRARAGDPGRGRTATAPGEIPARGWKDVAWRVYEEINNDRVLAVAAGVTFYLLLAIFPFITAFVSLYGLVADPTTVQGHLEAMAGILPQSALAVVGDQLNRLTEKPAGSLSLGFFISLAIALWSANAGMKAIFDALNVAYDEDEKRSFLGLNAVTLLFTLGSIVFLVLAAATIVVLPIVLKFVLLGQGTELIVSLARWPILLVLVALGIAVLYRYGPSRDRPKWRWVSWGSALASVLFVVVSVLFSWYAANFGNYDQTYGSLGAAVAFMTWIWISSTVILVGAELNSELEHQTAQDSTVGPDRPLGQRGAAMADSVGEAKSG